MFTRTALRTAGVAKIAARNMSRTAPLRSGSAHAAPKAPSSDVPWIVGSIAFTIPAAAYLLNSGSAPAHAKEDAHHAVEAVKKSIPEPAAAAESVEAAVKAAPSSVSEKVKGTAQKVAAKAEEAVPAVKKVLPAAAAVPEGRSDEDPAVRDPAAAKKDVDGDVTSGRMSDKQEGLSNTNTRHTLLETERGDAISKKSEGQHDSAKSKGTVDVHSEDKKDEKNDDESKPAEEKEEKKEEKKEKSSA